MQSRLQQCNGIVIRKPMSTMLPHPLLTSGLRHYPLIFPLANFLSLGHDKRGGGGRGVSDEQVNAGLLGIGLEGLLWQPASHLKSYVIGKRQCLDD